jgi:hypothetical protein
LFAPWGGKDAVKELPLELVWLLLASRYGINYRWRLDELDAKERSESVSAELAYSIMRDWPGHELAVVEDQSEDDYVAFLWGVSPTGGPAETRARITFETEGTVEDATREVAALKAYFEEHMRAEDLEGLCLLRRMWAIKTTRKREQEGQAAAAKAKEIQEARSAALVARRNDAADPSSKLYEALLLVQNGKDFVTQRLASEYSQKVVDSKSSKGAVLKMLRDPERACVDLDQRAWERDDGTKFVELSLTKPGEQEAGTWIRFHAPPLDVLKTQGGLRTHIPEPKTPKRTMATRTDII